uniref:Uncharacterized protein n=1 Tax=Arundo donax TaxID=35708 RepID=A0A0A9FQ42_ARUDO
MVERTTDRGCMCCDYFLKTSRCGNRVILNGLGISLIRSI